ncbi:MAG: M55 family metallopeptidase [Candidatus Latescibacteria bacterium]|nr:M55 family metallopeptidase [Candidatus Latescibacterota bacterium]
MKIYMHWDMEGTSGLFTRDQAWYWHDGVPEQVAAEGCRLITEDVNSAAQAALDAGVDEVIVCDTHHGGGNIILEEAISDPRITVHGKSRDATGRWMPDLDESVDALMLPGHHAKAGTPDAFLSHTWSLIWDDFQINGQSVGEMGIEACYAGYWDIPVTMVKGDETACVEAEALFPGVVTAAVKRAESYELASGLAPEEARALTAHKVKEAIANLRQAPPKPYKPSLPMTVTIRMAHTDDAVKAMQRPGVSRLDDHTVACDVERQCDVVKWIIDTGLPD